RSRCQTYRFGLLGEAAAVDVLTKNGLSTAEAGRAVAIAGGSPGQAMRFLADGVIDRAAELFAELERGGGFSDLSAWMKLAADDYAARQLEKDPLGSKDAF